MKRLIFALNFLVTANLVALHGIVRTSDGKSHEGDIRLDSDAVLIAETNATNRVELKNLALLRIQPSAPPASPLPATNASLVNATNGLLGLYFKTLDLTGAFHARIDSTIDFDWGVHSPAAGVNPGPFSVRWEGKLVPQFAEPYVFQTFTDDGFRLWVENKLVDMWRGQFFLQSAPLMLRAGEQHDIRVEFHGAGGRARVKLFWSSPSTPRSVIPATQLLPAAVPTNAPLMLPEEKVPPGVMMVGGSIIARRVHAADNTSIRFSDSAAEPALSTVNVARILFQPLPKETATRHEGRTGLLLKNQDFIEGEFRGLAQDKIKMSSVLFGIKNYDVGQVLTLVLRDLKPVPTKFTLKTRNESLFLVNRLRLEAGFIAVQDAALGGFSVPAPDLIELKSNP